MGAAPYRVCPIVEQIAVGAPEMRNGPATNRPPQAFSSLGSGPRPLCSVAYVPRRLTDGRRASPRRPSFRPVTLPINIPSG